MTMRRTQKAKKGQGALELGRKARRKGVRKYAKAASRAVAVVRVKGRKRTAVAGRGNKRRRSK